MNITKNHAKKYVLTVVQSVVSMFFKLFYFVEKYAFQKYSLVADEQCVYSLKYVKYSLFSTYSSVYFA